jgi:hypothetical protein
VISVLVKLSVASGVLPKSLFIRGVDIGHDRDPIASGGHADVFQGHYQGQLVAVKRLRIPSENRATVHPVSSYASAVVGLRSLTIVIVDL